MSNTHIMSLFNKEYSHKIQNGSILIIGLDKDIIIDISYHLLLSNIKKLYILGDKISINKFDSTTNIKFVKHIKQKQDITILINPSLEDIELYISNLDSKIIILFLEDMRGTIFVDCGDEYFYNNNELKTFHISTINNEGIVTTCNNNNLNNEDIIIFKNLVGTNLEHFDKEWHIEIINNTTFKLINFNITDFIFLNGTIYNVNKNITINHSRFNIKDIIHQKNKTIFPPIISIISSICVFEVFKLLTNLYKPISQWYEYKEDLYYTKELLSSRKWLVYDDNLSKSLLSLGVNIIDNTYELKDFKSIHGVLCNSNDINLKISLTEKCFKYDLPLITGSINSVNCMIPFLTTTLEHCQNDTSYPLCVIKSFPNEINHTIQWSLDNYDIFINAPIIVNKWINDDKYLDSLEDNEKSKALSYINFLTIKYPVQKTNIFACIFWAIEIFMEHFYYNIIQLLETFPANHKLESNEYYWSGSKRCPTPIKFDMSNSLHIDFVESITHLLARMSNIDDNITRENIIMISQDFIHEIKKESTEILIGNKTEYKPIFISQTIEEKAFWTNKCIYASSNIRASNYGIPNVDESYIYQHLYNNNPTLSTTTSLINSLITIEMIKYLLNNKSNNYLIDFTSDTIIKKSYPQIAKVKEIIETQINEWTKFNYTKNSSLSDFKTYYEKIFNITITMIVYGTTMIYADFLDDTNLEKQLSEILKEDDNILNLLCDDDTKEIPPITILL